MVRLRALEERTKGKGDMVFSLRYRTRFVDVLFPAEGRAGFVAVVEDDSRDPPEPEHIPFSVFLFAGGLGEEKRRDYLGLAHRHTETRHHFVVVVEKGKDLVLPTASLSSGGAKGKRILTLSKLHLTADSLNAVMGGWSDCLVERGEFDEIGSRIFASKGVFSITHAFNKSDNIQVGGLTRGESQFFKPPLFLLFLKSECCFSSKGKRQ